ncbi:uncharacterized protein LACBIDRAFT_309045 [Laccaria bicolor S238N-H82]|uniref:Probable RNA polymerase II nuclear localization protein SLC7A6OS n=1 Tax=Laccaria bicolor (strain S238N-H82 / ATCC MYA-4686) TaxID=486041 RepID=B0CVE7_LACBS|nr:uncharacterized protein LACBIDRAFT_309045 [Laccaria bicolor S238N-H82]EDR13317.1 predicted protein [Laccaria bicolor S238N-H82]|eukprot:XP_001875815.1 predicted protein [Laccaria bicolor S238N-H82]
MELANATTTSPTYTILRIKRKRNEEPLDALVVESRVRRKKSKGGIGVFQYAQTVEVDDWEDEHCQKDIQDQISKLARESREAKTLDVPSLSDVPPPAVPRQPQEEHSRRYTIVEHEEPEVPTRRFPTSPPKVVSAKDLPAKSKRHDFKMYDAIPSAKKASKRSEIDSEMEKFLPMLNDYLKIHDMDPSPVTNTSMAAPESLSSEGDYVWDVFYHRPATLSEWNEVANVGTLTGLPPSFGDTYDSASDSEEEDEADEDSNAEEYYKNDYPDEEDGDSQDSPDDSDEWHEDSDHDDMRRYNADGEDMY